MTNTKAQVGDLIRIVHIPTAVTKYEKGGIYEVIGYSHENTEDEQVAFVVDDVECFADHDWYVIHRKAGEEEDAQEPFGYSDATPTQDAVNHPNHYTQGKFETIEVIEEITKGYDDGFIAYCIGNTLKYIARAPFKHGTPAEDLAKAKRYIRFAIEHLDAKSTQD